MTATGAVRVLCFGNPWQGDDGFGIHVYRRLCGAAPGGRMHSGLLGDGVEVFDAGVAGFAAAPLFDGCRKVVIVDALRSAAPAGTLHRLTPDALAVVAQPASLHDLAVPELVAALPVWLGDQVPEIVVIGAAIAEIHAFRETLSVALASAVGPAVELVRWECTS